MPGGLLSWVLCSGLGVLMWRTPRNQPDICQEKPGPQRKAPSSPLVNRPFESPALGHQTCARDSPESSRRWPFWPLSAL